jgi:hypothetical protein
MAGALLQLKPDNRIGAEDALLHQYFDPLPKKLLELPDGKLKSPNLSKSFNVLHITDKYSLFCRTPSIKRPNLHIIGLA